MKAVELPAVIPAPQANGGLRVGQRRKRGDFLCRHGPTLLAKRVHLGGRQPAEILGLGRAEIALGRDMQPHRLADSRVKALRQPFAAGERSCLW